MNEIAVVWFRAKYGYVYYIMLLENWTLRQM